MSMLYVWNPTLLDEGRTLQVMITRGDSDQVGKGSTAFLTAIVTAVGAKATPKGARPGARVFCTRTRTTSRTAATSSA